MDTFTELFAQKRFQSSEQWMKDNLLYEVIMGSQAYGTNNENSDFDFVALVMPKHEHLYPQSYGFVLGFDQYPSFEHKTCKDKTTRLQLENGTDVEGEWQSLVNFFFLAGMKGSPSLVESLFARRALVKYAHNIGWTLRDNRKLFLSMRSFHAFKGYAFQQLSRLKNGVKEWNDKHTCDNQTRKEYFEKFGYDVKMAYHPLRLLDQLHQMLTENDLDLMRNREECKAMRRGEWGDFNRFEQYVLNRLEELEKLSLSSSLAMQPQTGALHQLLSNCIEEWYGSESKMQKQGTEYVSVKMMMDRLDNMEKVLNKVEERTRPSEPLSDHLKYKTDF